MDLGLCSGVTTNPSLMLKSKVNDIHQMIEKICKYEIEDVSVELVDPFLPEEDLVKEAVEYYNVNPEKVVIKVPMIDIRTPKLINALADEGIPVNLTCLMSAYQGIVGIQSLPKYISLFYRRMIDYYNSIPKAKRQITTIATYLGHYTTLFDKPKIICGSIRKTEDVSECFLSGADIVTIPYAVLKEMYNHPKTVEAVKEFTEKWKAK